MNVLLVEPSYHTTFPPLGLLRISAFFKSIGVTPKFIRGCDKEIAKQQWDRVFISTLFTYELPRTVKTINFYSKSVKNPNENIIVGGIGVTLLPDYVKSNAKCKILFGSLEKPNTFGFNEPPIATFIPDYDILNTIHYEYRPSNAFFARVSIGCVRKCGFCAVPKLEPNFGYLQPLTQQITCAIKKYGEKRDLIILDNNILALENIDDVIQEIKDLGFHKGAILNRAKRNVDFNQGIDVRLITPKIAKALGEISISPVRLALDHISVEKKYREGVKLLVDQGIVNIMTYVMFNFNDSPEDFYRRLQINLELSAKFNIRITGFPMRYCPINDVDRHFISPKWNWKYLRGVQCILNATHGVVSPNPKFFELSFGKDFQEFQNILSLPDDYIIYRNKYAAESREWVNKLTKLSDDKKEKIFIKLKEKVPIEQIIID